MYEQVNKAFVKDRSKLRSTRKIVEQIDPNTNEVINTYDSLCSASEAMIGTVNGRPSIKKCCGLYEENEFRQYKNYYWRYKK